jgi:hypothetical protein
MNIPAGNLQEYLALRAKARIEMLSIGANILCSCGTILMYSQQLDDHIDHWLEAQALKAQNG